MAKRENTSRGRNRRGSTALQPFPPERLTQGWPAPATATIRLARPAEADAVVTLLTEATALEEDTRGAIVDDTAGQTLQLGLIRGAEAMREATVRQAFKGDLTTAMAQLSLPLVAVSHEDEVLGAVLCLPSGTLFTLVTRSSPDPMRQMQALLSMTTIAKIKALAVTQSARSQGLAAALLRRAVQVYRQLGFFAVYGQFATGSGLDVYYRRQGFEVLAPDAPTDFGFLLTGAPLTMGAGPGEQIFQRWLRSRGH